MTEDRDWDLIRRAQLQITQARKLSDDSGADSLDSERPVFLQDARLSSERFANYKIAREIHRGGQGVVYEALQLSTQRKVAIKVLREGPFAGPTDRIRFEREIQVLAGLRHSNIVTIHDSGTSSGFFYFVMDYVPGLHLDEHVRSIETTTGRKIEIETCLRIFAKVCDAMNVAHLRGVIHRDLKPSNIRVDEVGEPHILDFGLAKLTGIDVSATTQPPAQTVTGQFVGSMPWASPEQAEGRPGDIDVRTDVYSLGVMLYQMLTGCFPYTVVGNMRSVIDNICNVAPKLPGSYRNDVDGELETIVLKSLSKEPERRYQSAGDLARDIQRYLNGEAIDAKRDSTTYLLGKHVRRHKVPVALAFALLLSIVGSTVWLGLLYRDARTARDNEIRQREIAESNLKRANVSERNSLRDAATAREVQAFLTGLFKNANPTETRGRELTAKEMLDEGERRLRRELADRPEVRLELLNTIAIAYRELGRFDEARRVLTSALDDQRGSLGPDHPLLARCLYGLARLESLGVNHKKAERLAREALDMRRRLYSNDDPKIAESCALLGVLCMDRDDFAEAESYLVEALEILRGYLHDSDSGVNASDVATCMSRLGLLYEKTGRYTDAELMYRNAISMYQDKAGEEHPDVAGLYEGLALVLQHRREFVEADVLLRRALQINRRVYGEKDTRVAMSLNILGTNYYYTGAYSEAEAAFDESLKIRRDLWGNEHEEVATCLNNLASVKMEQGDYDTAQRLFGEVLRIYLQIWGPDHSQVGVISANLGKLCQKQGKYSEAVDYYRDAVEIGRKHFGDRHPNVQKPLLGLGLMLTKTGDAASAEPILREVLAAYEDSESGNELTIALAKGALADCLMTMENHEEAGPMALDAFRAVETVKDKPARLMENLKKAIERIVRYYDAIEDSDASAEWRKKLESIADAEETTSP